MSDFARVGSIYLTEGWRLEFKDARYSYAEGIINVLPSCTLAITRPPASVVRAFEDERPLAVAVLQGSEFVRFTGFVVNVYRQPGRGTVAEIRSRGGFHVLPLDLRGASG